VSIATPPPRPRSFAAALTLVVAAGWLVRAWPALGEGGWRRVAAGYDDAVYFSAAGLLAQGELPYRDFVLVHPPGMLLFLAPVALLVNVVGATSAFSAARWLMTLLGAVNIALSARVAYRAAGPVGAIVAAACYAALPEIVYHERTTFLEPLLNLCCLLLADTWLAQSVEKPARRSFVAGLCLGMGMSVKAWALLWAPACLLVPMAAKAHGERSSGRASSRLATLGWLIAGAALAVGVIAAPVFLAAPRSFLGQTVGFQLVRPADGMAIGFERVTAMLEGSWPVMLLAIVGLTGAFGARNDPARSNSTRFFGVAWVLVVIAFLTSRTYWPHYNAHLAPASAHLAGLGAAALWSMGDSRRAGRRLMAIAVLAATIAVPLRHSLPGARARGDLFEQVGERVRSIPAGACYIAFEPAWALAGDRLPSVRPGQPAVVDVYATMLMAAHGQGRDHRSAGDELRSRAAQERVRELLAGCEYLSLGERGERQLTVNTARWIAAAWERLPPIGETGVDLWRLRQ
jgi:hypothetical protein